MISGIGLISFNVVDIIDEKIVFLRSISSAIKMSFIVGSFSSHEVLVLISCLLSLDMDAVIWSGVGNWALA